MQYWDDFRQRRQKVIQRYIDVKKNQRSNELLLKHLFLDVLIRYIRKLFKKIVRQRQFEMAWRFIKAKIVRKLTLRRQQFKSFGHLNRNRTRHSLTLLAQHKHEKYEQFSKQVLEDFLFAVNGRWIVKTRI